MFPGRDIWSQQKDLEKIRKDGELKCTGPRVQQWICSSFSLSVCSSWTRTYLNVCKFSRWDVATCNPHILKLTPIDRLINTSQHNMIMIRSSAFSSICTYWTVKNKSRLRMSGLLFLLIDFHNKLYTGKYSSDRCSLNIEIKFKKKHNVYNKIQLQLSVLNLILWPLYPSSKYVTLRIILEFVWMKT